MNKQRAYSNFGLVIVSAYAFIYLSVIALSLRDIFLKKDWLPFIAITLLSICVALITYYFYTVYKEERMRHRSPEPIRLDRLRLKA